MTTTECLTTDVAPEMVETGVQNDEDVLGTARQILALIFLRRRLLPGEAEADVDEEREYAGHLERIVSFVENQAPVAMILPAFPVKSPNRKKTLGHLPDFAEEYAFRQLAALCDEIKAVYEPGAVVRICSDGRVFSDLLRICDDEVSAYGNYLRDSAHRNHPGKFQFFNLDEVFTQMSCFETMRENLMVGYGEPLIDLVRRTKSETEAKSMYRGITKFIFEDFSGLDEFSGQANNAIQKAAKQVSYRVIQRSNAWSRLLKEWFPEAVRLSIHPQFRVSEKIGISLGERDNCWVTPWHSVAVVDGSDVTFMKRAEAEEDPAVMLAYRGGRPSHFVRHTIATGVM